MHTLVYIRRIYKREVYAIRYWPPHGPSSEVISDANVVPPSVERKEYATPIGTKGVGFVGIP